ncbi:MAG: hypothetical protein FJ290_23105 [Planctomycetes bacterium]|nr:hypothetical protein [Planctomycetota bacterium]
MVRTRLAVGSGVTAGFLLLMMLDSLLPGGPIFHILTGLILIGTLLEVYGLAERHGDEPVKALPVALLVAFVVWDYAVRVQAGALLGEPPGEGGEVLRRFYAANGLAAAAGLWVLAVAHLLARDPHRWLKGATATIAGFFYVWFIGVHWFPIRELGIAYVFVLVAVVKVGDSGAFFVGTRWGRRKLAPRASPNKTVEGAAGGLAASVASGTLLAVLFGLRGSVAFWVFFGLVVGVASQLGDLVASAIKRSAGAKDSGNLLPVLGGLLDMADSLLMAAPVALWLLAL